MNKDNLPYVFSVVFYVEFGGRPQLNAFWILPIFSHFQASLATQTLKNKSQIVFDGQCQKWSRLLASNDLKWRREFSNEDLRPKTPWTKTKTALTKTKTPWTKTTDANRCGQCPLSWFVTAIWECCGISSAVFTCDDQVYHLPFLQVSWEIGSSSVSCGYNAPSVKKIWRGHGRPDNQDLSWRLPPNVFGARSWGLGKEGVHRLSDILRFKIQCRMIWVSSCV